MTNHTVTPPQYETPPPSSLCPQCQQVEVDARHYQRSGTEEILYACDRGHAWIVHWAVV